ncbi:MAG TPA: SIR2 family protein [Solirubrobacteraceae bacterium]|nr:SIR2 family protein [Solirubrobacteraceae bacterium]
MEENQALIERVAAGFADGNVIPVLGAGCSAPQTDETGRDFEGFPLARDFVVRLRRRYTYLEEVDDFYSATVLIESQEGPAALIDDLTQAYSPAQRLPSYDALALLPFDSAISFNFDESLEEALKQAGRIPTGVVADEDVPLARRSSVTVVKPHGTMGRGASLRATRSRVGAFDHECRLVGALLQVLLANRAALFVGYGFDDHEIMAAVRRVRAWAGESYRRSTAILPEASMSLRAELEALKIDVLNGTAADMLGAIAAEYINRDQHEPADSERWRAHPLFRKLVSVRGRPTETQVVEALLGATEERLQGVGVMAAARQAAEAAQLCLQYRPNFAGLKYVADELTVVADSDSDDVAWREWVAYRERRSVVRREIANEADAAIGDAKQLLLYSQSQRVIDLLMDLEPRRRSHLTLIVPECRAKSPEPFQNALLIAEQLHDGGFKSIEVVADMVGLHLIMCREVDLVLMGLHKVFQVRDEQTPLAVVNAVGTDAVSLAAEHVEIPVLFVYEHEKIVYTEALETARETVSFDPECDIGACLQSGHGSVRVVCRQIGYDLVPWRGNMRAVVGTTG